MTQQRSLEDVGVKRTRHDADDGKDSKSTSNTQPPNKKTHTDANDSKQNQISEQSKSKENQGSTSNVPTKDSQPSKEKEPKESSQQKSEQEPSKPESEQADPQPKQETAEGGQKKQFGGYRWISCQDPSLLDAERCEFILIGATEDLQGKLTVWETLSCMT